MLEAKAAAMASAARVEVRPEIIILIPGLFAAVDVLCIAGRTVLQNGNLRVEGVCNKSKGKIVGDIDQGLADSAPCSDVADIPAF